MIERAALELDTLTIRIPMRLQRRGGRKRIKNPGGGGGAGAQPPPDATLGKGPVAAARVRRAEGGDERGPLPGLDIFENRIVDSLSVTEWMIDIGKLLLRGRTDVNFASGNSKGFHQSLGATAGRFTGRKTSEGVSRDVRSR